MASFLSNYKLFSKIIIISIFLDFLLRRLLFVSVLPQAITYIVTANYIVLMIALVALVYYRMYEFLLSKKNIFLKIPIVFGGFFFIVLMIVLLYLRTFDGLYYLLLLAFYIIITIFYMPLLYILIKTTIKSKVEYKISIAVFISVLITSFLINQIISSSTVIPYSFNTTVISLYLEKVSIYSMLVLMLYFSFYSLGKIKIFRLDSNISKISIFLIAMITSVLISRHAISNIFMQVFMALSVNRILPNFIYIFISMIFIFSLLMLILQHSNDKLYFFALSMFILSGLSSTDLYLRLLSIFMLIEIIYLNGNNELPNK